MELDHSGIGFGVMLGRVLQLSESTATKVDTIEARQAHVLPVVLHRLDRLERAQTVAQAAAQATASAAPPSTPPAGASRPWEGAARLGLAISAALAGFAANLQADQIGALIRAALRAGGSH